MDERNLLLLFESRQKEVLLFEVQQSVGSQNVFSHMAIDRTRLLLAYLPKGCSKIVE